MTARLVFLDTETTGLDPRRHRVWELAYIVRDPGEVQHHHFFDVDLTDADPYSLRVSRYYDRHPDPWRMRDADSMPALDDPYLIWARLAEALHGAVLVGFNPAFDAAFIAREMRRFGLAPTWHYRAHDMTQIAAGAVLPTLPFPFDTADVLAAYAVTIPDGQRHTALGDARAVRDLYDAWTATAMDADA